MCRELPPRAASCWRTPMRSAARTKPSRPQPMTKPAARPCPASPGGWPRRSCGHWALLSATSQTVPRSQARRLSSGSRCTIWLVRRPACGSGWAGRRRCSRRALRCRISPASSSPSDDERLAARRGEFASLQEAAGTEHPVGARRPVPRDERRAHDRLARSVARAAAAGGPVSLRRVAAETVVRRLAQRDRLSRRQGTRPRARSARHLPGSAPHGHRQPRHLRTLWLLHRPGADRVPGRHRAVRRAVGRSRRRNRARGARLPVRSTRLRA